MSFDSLFERQKAYEDISDIKLLRRAPVMIRLNGRSFSRLTKKLKKPYEPLFLEAMVHTMLYTVSDIQGSCFAYTKAGEITIVLKNDQTHETEPWYENRVQKMSSVAASVATLAFNRAVSVLDPELDLIGDAVFDGHSWAMPSIAEVVNNVISRQQDCRKNAVIQACSTALQQKFGRATTKGMMDKKTISEKLELLQEECGIIFNEEYPISFRLGVGAYKVPTITQTRNGPNTRNKWKVDWELPEFKTDGRDFLYNLILSGKDILRAENLSG